ncbi:hypothetical protein BC829DRAFT_409380 [Chytridium lagenaria]|nr:hypothetical protein BC829DRAFT_409380 [Chytridium lagenaria]
MSDGTTFYETLLDEIATDRLKELVMDSISNSSKLLRLLSRQKCITNLNLVMKPFASRSGNDDNTALTEENLLAFSELRNLKTSLAGLLYVAPLLPLSLNLRHLALAEAEDPAHEHYWPKFNDILSSNLLDQINSFSIKTYLDESASHCIPNLFSLLGRLKSLQECTLHVGHVFNLTNPDANALNSILKSMKPSSSLRFLDINIMMSDDSFIHLAGFLSRCERLETFRLVVPENNLALRDDEHLKLFLSLLLSAPNLKSLHLPPLFSSNRLRFLTDTLASHPKKGLIEILLNPSLYCTLLDDLPGLLQLPNAPEIVKLCMREMRGDEGSIDRLIRLLDWVAGNIESLRLTQFLVKDLILVSADDNFWRESFTEESPKTYPN